MDRDGLALVDRILDGSQPTDCLSWLAFADWLEEQDSGAIRQGVAGILRASIRALSSLWRPLCLGTDLDEAGRFFLSSRCGKQLPPLYNGHHQPSWPCWRWSGRHGVGRLPAILAGLRWLEWGACRFSDLDELLWSRRWLVACLLYASGVLNGGDAERHFTRLGDHPQSFWSYVFGSSNRLRSVAVLHHAMLDCFRGLRGGESGRAVPVIEAIEAIEGQANPPLYRQRRLACRGLHRTLVRTLFESGLEAQGRSLYGSRPRAGPKGFYPSLIGGLS